MKILKIVLAVLLGAFVVIQFFRPAKNISAVEQPYDITTKFTIPADVQPILKNSCYDCHSNNTRYPWYAEVQPAGWLLDDHIRDGKRSLNFSEFTSYRLARQYNKLEEIGDMVYDDKMPLQSYLLLHTDAKLSREQKEKVFAWVDAARAHMEALYPPDSLTSGRR